MRFDNFYFTVSAVNVAVKNRKRSSSNLLIPRPLKSTRLKRKKKGKRETGTSATLGSLTVKKFTNVKQRKWTYSPGVKLERAHMCTKNCISCSPNEFFC